MSKPRERWWSYARNMIRDYPLLKRQWDDIHEQNISADISGMPRGGSVGRTVEIIAQRQLPDEDDQKAYDAVTRAIEITQLWPNGADRLKLIRLMYWEGRSMTAEKAAVHIPVEYITAKRWHGAFVRLVGNCGGLKSKKTKDDT